MKRTGPIVLAMALAVVSCGGEVAGSTTTTNLTTTTMATTTTTIVSTTTSIPTASTSIPGQPVDFGPQEGDVLMVIGVAHDDVLNLRDLPGPSFDIVGRIAPNESGLNALGNTRDIGSAFWTAVGYRGITGWVHMSYVGFEGATDDETARVFDVLGVRPTGATMADLGRLVAGVFVSEEPASDLVMVTPVKVKDLGEVTYDVIGLGDDAIRGLRVHVLARPTDAGFVLDAVEVTIICGRGVAEDGLCP